MCQVIVVTSGKGGVGKTSTTANIGFGLAKMNKRVLLIDADIGLRNLDVVMGLENKIIYHIVDVVDGKCSLSKALIKDDRFQHLFLLPAAQTKDQSSISPNQMLKLIHGIKKDYDFIIIDCPAGIEHGFLNAIIAADRALVVTSLDVSSIRDADRVIGLLKEHHISDIKLIVNRVRYDLIKHGDMMSIEDVKEILSTDILGIIPDDVHVVASTNMGIPLVGTKYQAGKAYTDICKEIKGDVDINENAKKETKISFLSFLFQSKERTQMKQ